MRSPGAGFRTADDRGSVAVEFALILVPFLVLVFGIIQFGFFFFQSQALTATARDGARLASLGISDCGTWKQAVSASAAGIAVPVAKVSLSSTTPAAVGGTLTVSIDVKPLNFGFPFIPFSNSPGARVATARIESIGAVTPSCP